MKGLFLFLTLLISVNSSAQSKKEQIAILNYKIDSLNKEYVKDTEFLNNANQVMDRKFDLLSNKMVLARELLANKSATIESKLNTIASLETKNLQLAKALRDLQARQNNLLADKDELESEIDKLLVGQNSGTYYEADVAEEGMDEFAAEVVEADVIIYDAVEDARGTEASSYRIYDGEAESVTEEAAEDKEEIIEFPDVEAAEDKEEIIEFPDVEATFPGGPAVMMKWINDNIVYPQTSIEMNEQGRVFLSLVVEKDGSISNIAIERGVSLDIDREAKRVVRKMPNWIPGEASGRKVRARCRLPINFQLN